jgi:hypothetical protein
MVSPACASADEQLLRDTTRGVMKTDADRRWGAWDGWGRHPVSLKGPWRERGRGKVWFRTVLRLARAFSFRSCALLRGLRPACPCSRPLPVLVAPFRARARLRLTRTTTRTTTRTQTRCNGERTPLPRRLSRCVRREIGRASHGTQRAGLTMCREARKHGSASESTAISPAQVSSKSGKEQSLFVGRRTARAGRLLILEVVRVPPCRAPLPNTTCAA